MCISISCMCIYIYIYVYIEYVYIHIYICIYIYICGQAYTCRTLLVHRSTSRQDLDVACLPLASHIFPEQDKLPGRASL